MYILYIQHNSGVVRIYKFYIMSLNTWRARAVMFNPLQLPKTKLVPTTYSHYLVLLNYFRVISLCTYILKYSTIYPTFDIFVLFSVAIHHKRYLSEKTEYDKSQTFTRYRIMNHNQDYCYNCYVDTDNDAVSVSNSNKKTRLECLNLPYVVKMFFYFFLF